MGQDGVVNGTTDEHLVRSYASGNEAAFTELFHRYSGKLYSFLRIRLGKKKAHLLEELFQKTWLKIHLARKSFDPNRRFSSWFYTVALNTLRDELGSKTESAVHEELSETIADPSNSAEERQIHKDLIERMHLYLSDLPLNQRTALLLSDAEELSSQEIAEVMCVSDVSARQLISRARRAIRQRFLKEDQS